MIFLSLNFEDGKKNIDLWLKPFKKLKDFSIVWFGCSLRFIIPFLFLILLTLAREERIGH